MLEAELPESWRGHPTRFATTWDPVVRQRVEVSSPVAFARSRTGLTLDRAPTTVEWLSLTGQAVLEVAGGPVFRDDTGELTAIRDRLDWYPDDVWRYAMAADWSSLGEELPFVGRAAERGDDAGSRLLTARLARTRHAPRLPAGRRWPPYAKWLGTVFATLPGMARGRRRSRPRSAGRRLAQPRGGTGRRSGRHWPGSRRRSRSSTAATAG